MEVEQQVVREEVVQAWAESRWYAWTQAQSEHDSVEELQARFLAECEEHFEPLVGGVLMLREAERRWPQLEIEQVQAESERMQRELGELAAILHRRLGPEAWLRHVERRLRLQFLEQSLSEAIDPERVSQLEAELMRSLLATSSASDDSPIQGPAEIPPYRTEPTQSQTAPTREQAQALARARSAAILKAKAASEWVAARREHVEAALVRPDGKRVRLSGKPSPAN